MKSTRGPFGQTLIVALAAAALLGAAEWGLRALYRHRSLPAARRAPGRITVAALGDSIVAGWPGSPASAWPSLLQARLLQEMPVHRWQVIGAGMPGDTAPLGYMRFERDVAAAGPDLVLIAFGLNDCNLARHGLDGWLEAQTPRGLALRSYAWQAASVRFRRWGRQNGLLAPAVELNQSDVPRTSAAGFAAALAALVDRVRVIRARPVLVTMTPVRIGASDPASTLTNGAGAANYARYNRVIEICAREMGVPLVLLPETPPPGSFVADGVHLTPAGQAWVAGHVYGQLRAIGLWAMLAGEDGG